MAKKTVVRTEFVGNDVITHFSDGSTETITSTGVVSTSDNSVIHTGTGDINISSTVNYS